ncbi:uncharacterized protein LOC122539298 [Chiloscyllium plagiosum]|uniref:uncharacterized protein LOC122539298 n=1 Tax=Chiloscyllium plagiosum TaxID=36176 RepID=UPI001CB7F9AB|nr:uncharacterized protein LOC122539298 [Chiloscyllium plagiosum]XP_043529929.1 uncharacterized protein LOC122539298 [Chiloscyllium plagiosum]
MQTVVLTLCLVVVALANPLRKARDLESGSRENNYRYYGQFYPPLYRPYYPFQPGYPRVPFSPYYPIYPQFPGYFPSYNKLPQYPNFPQYPNYGPVYNGFSRNSNSELSKIKEDNIVGQGDPQEYSVLSNPRPLSISSEVSFEDSSSMEYTDFMPYENVPYGGPGYEVPGDPDNEEPFAPDNEDSFLPGNEGPFTPSVDPNAVDVGVEQESETDVSNPEQPVLPYTDSVQGGDPLGSNVEDDSVISESHKGLNQQNTISEHRLDVNRDGNMNNEQFANQQMSNGNLDEDDQTEEDEAWNVGFSLVDVDSIGLSNDYDVDGIEEADSNKEDNDEESNEDNSEQNEAEDSNPYLVLQDAD